MVAERADGERTLVIAEFLAPPAELGLAPACRADRLAAFSAFKLHKWECVREMPCPEPIVSLQYRRAEKT